MKPWLRIVLVCVAIVVILILIAPLFVNANTFRPTLQNQLSNALNRSVTIGDLGFSPFSGSLVAKNVTIADDPAFSEKPFLDARKLRVGVQVFPLIFHRRLLVTSFVADSPLINLIHSANGTWNFSSIGHTATSQNDDPPGDSAFPNLTVGAIKIENGTVTVSAIPPAKQPFVYTEVHLSAWKFSFGKSFPFQISAALPAGGSLELDGIAGPVSRQDAAGSPFNARITLKQFDPLAAGVIDSSHGLSMLMDASGQAISNGQVLTANGIAHVDRLKLVSSGTPAQRPVDFVYNITHNLDARTGQVNKLDLRTGSVTVHIDGTYQIPGSQPVLALRLSASNDPIDQLEALLPAAGIRLPSGSSLQGGTLTANLNITGPANALTISGPVKVDNTRLAGFDLGSQIGGLNPIGGSKGGTAIQTARANVTASPSGTGIQNLYVSVPSTGTATGNGTISPAGNLNFRLLAKLNSAAMATGGGSGLPGHPLLSAVASKGIPLVITGTTSRPLIRADLNGVFRQNAGSLLKQQLKQQSPGSGFLNRLGTH